MPSSFQALLDGMEGLVYVVDRERRIAAIGEPNWNAFAAENGGASFLDLQAILGRPLLEFVQGDEVAAAYEGYMSRLFDGAIAQVRFPFRCDAPDLQRDHWMSIRPLRDGASVAGLLYQSITLDALPRPPIDLFDAERLHERLKLRRHLPVVSLCAYCSSVAESAGDGAEWLTPEVYYRNGGRSDVQISHGICPSCYDRHVRPFLGT